MMKNEYRKIIATLENECAKELRCAVVSEELRKKTLNPFKRFSCRRSRDRFRQHVFGIQMAIKCVKKGMES